MTVGSLFRNINRAFYYSTSKHIANSNSDTTESRNDASRDDWRAELRDTMRVLPNFISENEEDSLMQEVDPYMKRLRYEYSHWDNVGDTRLQGDRMEEVERGQLADSRQSPYGGIPARDDTPLARAHIRFGSRGLDKAAY